MNKFTQFAPTTRGLEETILMGWQCAGTGKDGQHTITRTGRIISGVCIGQAKLCHLHRIPILFTHKQIVTT